MKKISLDGHTISLFEDEDIRPSQLRKLRKSIFTNGIYEIIGLCRLTEKELMSLDGFDDNVICVIKKRLNESGLSLGMTESDLENYEDEEYNIQHPTENAVDTCQVIPKDWLKKDEPFDVKQLANMLRNPDGFALVVPEQETDEPAVQLTNSIKLKLMIRHEKEMREKVEDQLTDHGLSRLYADDIEWMKFHFIRTFYADQPWYIRLFRNREERLVLAQKEADNVVDKYLTELTDKIVTSRQKSFSRELDTCWDKRWKEYLKSLE